MTTNTAVPHLAERIQYNEDEAAWLKAGGVPGQEPWRKWEVGYENMFENVVGHPYWDKDCQFRRKPRTIKIGDCEVPEPVREALEMGQSYWVVDIAGRTMHSLLYWSGSYYDLRHLERGLIHLAKEAASAHSEALVKLSGGAV